jgi:FUN14 domain-containing protein 1
MDAAAMAKQLFTVAASEYAGQLSVGAITGFCSGYALKKVSKAAAFLVGLGFIGFQVARYHGVVQSPDWQAMDDKLVTALDANGDGKVDLEDLQVHLAKVKAYLSVGLPSAGAFGVAFILGIKSG